MSTEVDCTFFIRVRCFSMISLNIVIGLVSPFYQSIFLLIHFSHLSLYWSCRNYSSTILLLRLYFIFFFQFVGWYLICFVLISASSGAWINFTDY